MQGLQSYKIQILTSKEIKVARVAKLHNPNLDLFEDIKVARVAKLQSCKIKIQTFKDVKVAKAKIQILTSKDIKVARVAKLQNPNFDL